MAPAINKERTTDSSVMEELLSEVSSYPQLEKPVFQDNIPAHLLVGIDDRTRYSIQQLSLISQQNEWLIKAATDTNEQVRHTNGRVKVLEAWKVKLQDSDVEKKLSILNRLFGFWSVLATLIVVGSMVAGVVFGLLKAVGIGH